MRCGPNTDGLSTKNSVNTVSTQCQHSVNTVSTQFQHSFNTVSTQCQHSVDTVSTQFQHSVNTVSTQCQHSFNTVSTQCQQQEFQFVSRTVASDFFLSRLQTFGPNWDLLSNLLNSYPKVDGRVRSRRQCLQRMQQLEQMTYSRSR